MFLSQSSIGQKSQLGSTGTSAEGLLRLKLGYWLAVFLLGGSGKNLLPGSFRLWAECTSLWLQDWGPHVLIGRQLEELLNFQKLPASLDLWPFLCPQSQQWCWCVESFLNSKYLWLLLLFSRAHVVTLGPPGQSSLSHYFKGSWLTAVSTSTNSLLSRKAKQLRLWHHSVKVIGAKILPTSVTLEVGFPRSEDRHGPKVCSDLTSRLPRWLSG